MKNKFEYYKNAVTGKYFQFDGRATRSEYWYFVLFNFLISIVLSIVASIAGGKVGQNVLSSIYSVLVFIPSIAVSFRRLHDTGRSGWWLLLSFVPVVGWIVLLVFMVMDSTPDNKYGPNPKGVTTTPPPVQG